MQTQFLTWDWMLSLVVEYRMVKKCRLSFVATALSGSLAAWLLVFGYFICGDDTGDVCDARRSSKFLPLPPLRARCARRVGLVFGPGWLAVVGTGIALPFSYIFSIFSTYTHESVYDPLNNATSIPKHGVIALELDQSGLQYDRVIRATNPLNPVANVGTIVQRIITRPEV
ncbi:hypothetical protein FIBSPDRAFT_899565 [Athelia psychrophila]|uniref:Uncharacterized protein n=1 Tax=Athelia psychrophila TaxID=1759441 RepID=A0A165ZLH0_9AGAM|nr:hypothetical protein FIBSPDRAFT_899565 [Fibularhizoctonia sp. CBS 109695]